MNFEKSLFMTTLYYSFFGYEYKICSCNEHENLSRDINIAWM